MIIRLSESTVGKFIADAELVENRFAAIDERRRFFSRGEILADRRAEIGASLESAHLDHRNIRRHKRGDPVIPAKTAHLENVIARIGLDLTKIENAPADGFGVGAVNEKTPVVRKRLELPMTVRKRPLFKIERPLRRRHGLFDPNGVERVADRRRTIFNALVRVQFGREIEPHLVDSFRNRDDLLNAHPLFGRVGGNLKRHRRDVGEFSVFTPHHARTRRRGATFLAAAPDRRAHVHAHQIALSRFHVFNRRHLIFGHAVFFKFGRIFELDRICVRDEIDESAF